MENYKLVFIYGVNDPNKNIKNGEMEGIGDVQDETLLHINCLLDYAKTKYPNIPIFQQLNNRHRPETVAYFLTLLGHIVFFNTTKNVKKHGKSGLFMFPKEITEEQKETLSKFCKTIEDFSITVTYDLQLVDGILDSKEFSMAEVNSPSHIINSFFTQYRNSSLEKNKNK